MKPEKRAKGELTLTEGTSNKAIKGLTRNKLARVEKTEEGLLVSLG